MGLDQYLYKANRKFTEVNDLYRHQALAHITDKDLDRYNKILEGDVSKFIKGRYTVETLDRYLKGEDKELISQLNRQIESFVGLVEEYNKRKDLEDFSSFEVAEAHYWRKHSDLQGYMEDLWICKGGEGQFNCESVILNLEDCEAVINYAKGEILKFQKGEEINHDSGFFWGETEEEDWRETLSAFEDIIATVDFNEETVYYSSWW